MVETASHIDAERVEYHVGIFAGDSAAEHPLAQALRARGARVHVIADRRGISATQIRDIVQLMRAHHIEVLHSSEFRSNVLALLCRLRYPVRLVTTVHGWIANDVRGRLFRFADKLMLPLFDAVVMVSAATSRLVPRWWLTARKVHVVWNALPPGYGREPAGAAARSGGEGRVVLLNVGRLSAEKGQDLLLRAVARLAQRSPGVRLRFAGIGPERSALERLTAELDISAHVEFLDFVADMPALYRDADIVVQSSLTEGMPNVILEAAALGVPVVATDVGGTAEIVQDRANALLVPAGSVEALSDALVTVVEHLTEYRANAARLRDAVIARFCIEARARRIESVYGGISAGIRQPG